MRYRYGENGKFTEDQSTTPIGGMALAFGCMAKQWAVGRSMVSWYPLFLLQEEGGVSGSARSLGDNLCRGANYEVFPALRAYGSGYGGKQGANSGLCVSG